LTSLGLTYLASSKPKTSGSVMEAVKTLPAAPAALEAPAVPDSKTKEIPK
jgi:hypothetical protein